MAIGCNVDARSESSQLYGRSKRAIISCLSTTTTTATAMSFTGETKTQLDCIRMTLDALVG